MAAWRGLVALCLLAGCEELGPEPDPARRVLWITVDHQRDGWPSILSEGRAGGVLFETLWCPSASVRSNAATALTGVGPWQHGIGEDLADRAQILPSVPALAYGQEAWTAAVVSVPGLARASGVEEGFEQFDGRTGVPAPKAAQQIQRYLREHGEDRGGWFLWVHLSGEGILGQVDQAIDLLLEEVRTSAWARHCLVAICDLAGEAHEPAWTVRAWIAADRVQEARVQEDARLADLAPLFLEHLTLAPLRERRTWLPGIEGASLGHGLLGLAPHDSPPVMRVGEHSYALANPWWMDDSGQVGGGTGELASDLRAALVDSLRKAGPVSAAPAQGE